MSSAEDFVGPGVAAFNLSGDRPAPVPIRTGAETAPTKVSCWCDGGHRGHHQLKGVEAREERGGDVGVPILWKCRKEPREEGPSGRGSV
jgi:hypothetical protein